MLELVTAGRSVVIVLDVSVATGWYWPCNGASATKMKPAAQSKSERPARAELQRKGIATGMTQRNLRQRSRAFGRKPYCEIRGSSGLLPRKCSRMGPELARERS